MNNRYATGNQGEFEPGSDDRVLRNTLGIRNPAEMDEAELVLLEKLYEYVLLEDFPDRRLTVNDLKSWHRLWLGNIYEWAGTERAVNLGKDGFQFASTAQIPRLLADFQRNYLASYTPCRNSDQETSIAAIAVTHVELILIHPFREGNGRLSRLLSDVMAVQSGHSALDYSAWEADKPGYIRAIHAGLAGDYQPMQYWIKRAWTP